MAFIRRCCCCRLRYGAFFVASYSFLESLMCMTLFLVRYVKDGFIEYKAEYETITYSTLASFGLLTIFAAVLFVGVKMEMVVLFVPWMILRIIMSFYSTIAGLSLVYIEVYHFHMFVLWDTALALVLFYIAGFGVYMELVILSYYEHVRDGKDRRQRRLRRPRSDGSACDRRSGRPTESTHTEISELEIAVIAAAMNSQRQPPLYQENPPPYYEESDPYPATVGQQAAPANNRTVPAPPSLGIRETGASIDGFPTGIRVMRRGSDSSVM